VFSLTPPAGVGGWTEKVLHNFPNPAGVHPLGVVVGCNMEDGADASEMGGTLVLYGTTTGSSPQQGFGTVFALTTPENRGGTSTEALLHPFSGRPDGDAPAGLIFHRGVLYGATQAGGTDGAGTVFSLKLCESQS